MPRNTTRKTPHCCMNCGKTFACKDFWLDKKSSLACPYWVKHNSPKVYNYHGFTFNGYVTIGYHHIDIGTCPSCVGGRAEAWVQDVLQGDKCAIGFPPKLCFCNNCRGTEPCRYSDLSLDPNFKEMSAEDIRKTTINLLGYDPATQLQTGAQPAVYAPAPNVQVDPPPPAPLRPAELFIANPFRRAQNPENPAAAYIRQVRAEERRIAAMEAVDREGRPPRRG